MKIPETLSGQAFLIYILSTSFEHNSCQAVVLVTHTSRWRTGAREKKCPKGHKRLPVWALQDTISFEMLQ